jgi:hypothetical protein
MSKANEAIELIESVITEAFKERVKKLLNEQYSNAGDNEHLIEDAQCYLKSAFEGIDQALGRLEGCIEESESE